MFFEEISSLPLEKQNERAHEILRRYLEEGIASEFEKEFAEKIRKIKEDIIDRLGDKAIIFGLMGSGKTDLLAKIATYYVSRYSEKSVVIVVPDRGSSDIIPKIKEYLGRDVNIDVKLARSINEKIDSLLEYEVIIFDDVDLALAKNNISLDTLAKLVKFNRKVYFALDPVVLSVKESFNRVLSTFSDCNIVILKSVAMPEVINASLKTGKSLNRCTSFQLTLFSKDQGIKINELNVKFVKREVRDSIKKVRSPTQIVKFIPHKSEEVLLPGISPKKNQKEFYTLLYLCLKASKYSPNNLPIEDKKKFEQTLTEWMKLNKKVIELTIT